MRIHQARVSKSVSAFKAEYLKKFSCMEAYDIYQPVVFFGLYDESDYAVLTRFCNKIIIVWCGTDTMMIDQHRLNILRGVKVTHIVKSKFMSDDLKRFNIPHKIIPISWQDHNINPIPLGDNIFHYGRGDFYGEKYLDAIEKATGLCIIRTIKDTYSKEELKKSL